MKRESLQEAATAQPRPWLEDGNGQVTLLASLEVASGKYFFPPIPPASPVAKRFRTVPLSREATLYSFTVVHPNPKTGKEPFALVYADFPQQVRVLGRLSLAPGQRPVIGSTLRVEVERGTGADPTYVFVPS